MSPPINLLRKGWQLITTVTGIKIYEAKKSKTMIKNRKILSIIIPHSYSVDSIKRTVHLTFHGLFFLLKVLFFWKIENSTFNRDSTKFICLKNFQCTVCLTETKYLLQYVFEFKKFVLNLHTYIGTYLCTCKYHPLETTYLLCMHTNVHCTELKTVFLIETVRKFICLENFQCTVLLIETKRKICNSTFNRTVCLIESTE